EFAEKTEQWKERYSNISILLSTHLNEIKNPVYADTVFFVDENTNIPALSQFLMKSKTNHFAFMWQGGIINNDLFELIYSFYPDIIEQKKTHNSGYLLLGKTENTHQHFVYHDFEPPNSPVTKKEPLRIRRDSETGNHTYFYGENDEWGITIEIPVDSILPSPSKITVTTDFMFESEKKEIPLVFTTLRKSQTHLYAISKIDRFARETGKWYRAAFSIQNPELQEGDLIKFYFWNRNKAQFQIDNLKIDFGDSE